MRVFLVSKGAQIIAAGLRDYELFPPFLEELNTAKEGRYEFHVLELKSEEYETLLKQLNAPVNLIEIPAEYVEKIYGKNVIQFRGKNDYQRAVCQQSTTES